MDIATKDQTEATPEETKKQDFAGVESVIKNLPKKQAQAQEQTAEEKPKRGRGRPKKEVVIEKQAKPEHLEKVFKTINIFLKKFKIDPLDNDEIKEGVEVWFDIYKELFPSVGGKSIWFGPLLWTGGVVSSRSESLSLFKKPKSKAQEAQEAQEETVEPDQPVISDTKTDWSKSTAPGDDPV